MQLTNRIWCGLALSASLLLAQGDPPGRVARLSYIYGAASYRPAGVDDWSPVDPNRPLTTGDHFFVDVAGTAELQIGSGALRMNQATSLEFLNLDDSNVQLRLSEGSLLIHLRYLGDQETFEVDTPNLAFSLLRTGIYRIDVKPDSSATIVTVRAGEGELTGPDQALSIHPGDQEWVTGADQPNYQTYSAPPPDYLDTWSAGRDQREDQSQSVRYVSRQLIGYQDLDQYGSWRPTPEYGAVWVPNNTPSGWAPYHNGHWLWVDPWGWTWVDEAPWGFAPFHYGRWAYVGNTWGWIPGPVAERPVYAPALVAWVGGAGVGGAVAWFALGPREVYVPTYHVSPVYVNRVNVSNTVIVNNVNITNVNVTNVTYVNRSAPGAIMAVQQNAFASARPVQSAAVIIRPEQLRTVNVVAAVSVAPTRESVTRVAVGGAKIVQPPAALQSRPVIAKRTPPPPPVPFVQKQQALAANGGRPLDTNQVQQLRKSQPAPAQPLVRQVQARPPAAAPQRSAAPAPSITAPTPQTAKPLSERPAPTQTARPATQAAPATPAPSSEVKPDLRRPAPAENQTARPAPAAPVARPTPSTPAPSSEAKPEVRRPAPGENQTARPEQPAPAARPAPAENQTARPAPAARPAPSARPGPGENQPAARPAPKKEGDKKESDKKKDEKKKEE